MILSRRRSTVLSTLCLGCVLVAATEPLSAQRRGPRRVEPSEGNQLGHTKAATEAMVGYYQTAKHWALRSIVLLSFGKKWHPAGSEAILLAFRDKDKRLRCFALEVLLRSSPAHLPSQVTKDLLAELIAKQSKVRNKFYRERVQTVLSRALPKAGCETASAWQVWWSNNREKWVAPAWEAPDKKKLAEARKGGTVVTKFIERAFDLNSAGLDVTIVIDSTGSMQVTIDRARDALGEIVTMLSGIAPKLRVGLVHYRDLEDMGGGARMLMPLTSNVAKVRKKLSKLVAGGGGDSPERVAKGLGVALSPQLKWNMKANKVVIVMGDAPPKDPEAAVELARKANKDPGSALNRRAPTTGKKKKIRPFVINAISVGARPVEPFRDIAKAGGGAFAHIHMGGRRGAREPGRRRGPRARGPKNPQREVVRHILTLSFGARFEKQMSAFIDIFYAYRAEKLFK